MKNTMKAVLLASILLPCLSFAMASQAGWEVYRAEKYGFEMLVPKGTHLEEHEWKDGYGGLYAKNGAIELYGMAQIKSDATPEEIEAYGVEVSGIAEDHWEKIDEGKGNGWSSYRTYKAQNANTVVYAGLGAGPKGSYLLMLKTTADDVAKHEADYKKWYASLKLF